MEDQNETTEDKLAPELDLRFLAKVVLAGLALHFAGYAAAGPAAGDAAAIVVLAGWLWGARNIEDEGKP
jgi:hypothetical protein